MTGQTDQIRARKPGVTINLVILTASIVVCLVVLEIALRGYQLVTGAADATAATETARPADNDPAAAAESNAAAPEPLHVLVDTPVLYGLNPGHPEINAQGLRDDAVAIPKPAGTTRILMLGDSVAYGAAVDRDRTFPNVVERALRNDRANIEVINSGVSGYTTYNELQYYLIDGRRFGSDIVFVAFCMNDVVNPRLHWGYTQNAIAHIPDEAIPNAAYDRDHILPFMQRVEAQRRRQDGFWTTLLSHSELYRTLRWKGRALVDRLREAWRDAQTPTLITGEDSISIEVLLDEASPEWRWLTGMLTRLKDAVTADGATFGIVILPLAYQLDDGYPYFPQENLLRYCEQQGIPCLDLLPAFADHAPEDIFIMNRRGFRDVWHLTEFGHEKAAAAIAAFVRERRLLTAE
jgi:lysophospholipase L1-like esterase